MNEPLVEASAAIESAERIVTIGHIGPDGDALGSALGLATAARQAGKDAYATFGAPFALPGEFEFLDRSTLVAPGDVPADVDVAIACDTAAVERLGSAYPIIERAEVVIVVDHHLSNDGFGDIAYIDSDAAATTQLVFYLLEELGWPLTEPVAEALYTGLVTDTGRFQYSSTSPEVHRVAAELLACGVDVASVGQHLFEAAPFGYYSVASRVLGRAELEVDNGLVWSVMFAEDLSAAGIPYQEADPLIDLVRIAKEVGVACLLKEIEPGRFKGSLRSRGAVDVAAVAKALGGGGHHNAAGFTIDGPVNVAMRRVRELLP